MSEAMTYKLPPMPFAVFDEFGKSCEDRVRDHFIAAIEAQVVSDGWTPTDDELTTIYKKANGEDTGKAQPLTQQQVVEGFCKTPHKVQYVAVFDAGVRFAEAAHGIKGS